ncbi:MAG: hypothetical protein M3R51_05630 [Candidatus Eremiobacteraeota bacterium]|nr:hypothetical protein [Candidatus Eremiobacteraeota bacterium]
MSDDPIPDFAMQRAVEILAGLYERTKGAPRGLPEAFDKPIALFNESLALDVTKTTRRDVQRQLGIAFQYPAAGWHTYCVRGSRNKREFLSVFYSRDSLVSAELYYPRVDRAPKLEPVDLYFRLSPGEFSLGSPFTGLPEHFGRFSQAGETLGAYREMFEARFPGGVAYAMGNEGVAERLAIYVLRGGATTAQE